MSQADGLDRWEWWLLAAAATVFTFGFFAVYALLFWLLDALLPRRPMIYRHRRRLRRKRAPDPVSGDQGGPPPL